MAKVTGPLLSMSASGSVAGAMVFSSSKGRPYVRQLVVPRNPKTAGQLGVRANMAGLNKLWATMSDADKATWDAAAKAKNVSTWNAFVARNQSDFANGMGDQRQDPVEPSDPPAIAGTVTDSVEGNQVTISFLEPATGDCFGLFVYVSPTTGFTPASANCRALVVASGTPLTELLATLPGLATGEYFYRVRGFDFAGEFGTVSAQGSFTIA